MTFAGLTRENQRADLIASPQHAVRSSEAAADGAGRPSRPSRGCRQPREGAGRAKHQS